MMPGQQNIKYETLFLRSDRWVVGWVRHEAREIRSAHRILRRKYFENHLVGTLRMKFEYYITIFYT
jgi:hypothetical protein